MASQNGNTAQTSPYDYIADKVERQLAWYDKKARRNKRAYTATQVLTLLFAATVPVATTLSQHFPPIWMLATGLALAAGLLGSFERVLHFRDQWQNYRLTEMYIAREVALYREGAGPYRQLKPQEARLQLVERVEEAIAAEGSATLTTLTVPTQAHPQPHVRFEMPPDGAG
jgi:hypothetical protein